MVIADKHRYLVQFYFQVNERRGMKRGFDIPTSKLVDVPKLENRNLLFYIFFGYLRGLCVFWALLFWDLALGYQIHIIQFWKQKKKIILNLKTR